MSLTQFHQFLILFARAAWIRVKFSQESMPEWKDFIKIAGVGEMAKKFAKCELERAWIQLLNNHFVCGDEVSLR